MGKDTPSKAGRPPKTWEYLHRKVRTDMGGQPEKIVENWLNELGGEGWEAFFAYRQNDMHTLVMFKRIVKS